MTKIEFIIALKEMINEECKKYEGIDQTPTNHGIYMGLNKAFFMITELQKKEGK